MFMKTFIVALGIAAGVLQPLAGVAADPSARPVKDLSHASSEIHWPQGFEPKTVDAFVHNEIFIKAPANVIWQNLVKATQWPKWYSNSSDMQIAGGAKTELEADVEFTWKTFGFPIKSAPSMNSSPLAGSDGLEEEQEFMPTILGSLCPKTTGAKSSPKSPRLARPPSSTTSNNRLPCLTDIIGG